MADKTFTIKALKSGMSVGMYRTVSAAAINMVANILQSGCCKLRIDIQENGADIYADDVLTHQIEPYQIRQKPEPKPMGRPRTTPEKPSKPDWLTLSGRPPNHGWFNFPGALIMPEPAVKQLAAVLFTRSKNPKDPRTAKHKYINKGNHIVLDMWLDDRMRPITCTPLEPFNQPVGDVCLAHATKLLRNEEPPIGAVARAVGFIEAGVINQPINEGDEVPRVIVTIKRLLTLI